MTKRIIPAVLLALLTLAACGGPASTTVVEPPTRQQTVGIPTEAPTTIQEPTANPTPGATPTPTAPAEVTVGIPTEAPTTIQEPTATPTPSATPTPTAPAEVDALAMYDDNGNGKITCAEAEAHGIAPVRRGHPAYQYMNDRDGDGIVCE